MSEKQTDRKIKLGTVTSNKMEKTITVRVDTIKQHSLYKKTIRTSKKYKSHDENNEANIGDVVKIIECRPLSKDKRWRLLEIVKRAKTLE